MKRSTTFLAVAGIVLGGTAFGILSLDDDQDGARRSAASAAGPKTTAQTIVTHEVEDDRPTTTGVAPKVVASPVAAVDVPSDPSIPLIDPPQNVVSRDPKVGNGPSGTTIVVDKDPTRWEARSARTSTFAPKAKKGAIDTDEKSGKREGRLMKKQGKAKRGDG